MSSSGTAPSFFNDLNGKASSGATGNATEIEDAHYILGAEVASIFSNEKPSHQQEEQAISREVEYGGGVFYPQQDRESQGISRDVHSFNSQLASEPTQLLTRGNPPPPYALGPQPWQPGASAAVASTTQQYYHHYKNHSPASHSLAEPMRGRPVLAAAAPIGYPYPAASSYPYLLPPPSADNYYVPPQPPMVYRQHPPPPPYGVHDHAPPPFHPNYHFPGYPHHQLTHTRIPSIPAFPTNDSPPQQQQLPQQLPHQHPQQQRHQQDQHLQQQHPQHAEVLNNSPKKRKHCVDLTGSPEKRVSPTLRSLPEDPPSKQPPTVATTLKDKQRAISTPSPVSQQEDDFLRNRMTDRDLLRHFYNYYHTKGMSLRAYTTQQHIGRSQFMRRWKELDVSACKDHDLAFGDKEVLEKGVGAFFARRQTRVVNHSTGGCRSFLTADEEETFLAIMSEKAGDDNDVITKEIFLPTIKEIVEKDIPADLVDFVSKAIVESLWKRKLSRIRKLSDLKASKKLAAKIKDNRVQIGNIHTKQREIKIKKEFIDKVYAYIEKKAASYWMIVQSSEADGDTDKTTTTTVVPTSKLLDTSKEELFLMAQLLFEGEVYKEEIKAGNPWVDLLRLRVRTQIKEQGVVLNKELFNSKVKELELSIQEKEKELKEMKDKLSSSA